MTESAWLSDFQKAHRDIYNAARDLLGLAAAFRTTGNADGARKIKNLADTILVSNDKSNKAVGKLLDRNVKMAYESSVNVFKSALAGTELEKEKDNG